MVDVNVNFKISGDDKIRRTNEDAEELKRTIATLKHQLEQVKSDKFKSDLTDLSTAVGKMATAFTTLSGTFGTFSTKLVNTVGSLAKATTATTKLGDMASAGVKATVEDYRVAMRTLGKLDKADLISERQSDILGRRLKRVAVGNMTMDEFTRLAPKTSKVFAKEFDKALDFRIGYTLDQARKVKVDSAVEQNKLDREAKRNRDNEAAAEKLAEQNAKSTEELRKQVKLNTERLRQEREKTTQAENKTEERRARGEANVARDTYRAGAAYARGKVAWDRMEQYFEQKDYAEIARRQKLERNDESRKVLRTRMQSMFAGTYDLEEEAAQRLMRATKRLKDTAVNIRNFAETKGYKGTVGAEATSELRAQQFYKTLMSYATEWKRTNSEEGKAADTLGRMADDAKDLQGTVNGIHTAFGQIASTISAIRSIGVEIRKTLTTIIQPVLNVVRQVSSAAFKSSLDALKNIELSEIGFSNFFGESAVPGIMQNVKQAALLSPLSAAQVASYVNQIAPLSGGNSQLALNAAMGVAKMIQYSGGEVSSEMEYVVRNLRDVIAKGTATTIDIRQFNRAMPALKKVLQDMGLEDFLKDGEISISKETAPKLLEAFQKINDYEDVGTIFERTSETISGLMERLEEQVQLFIIDVGEFSGLTKLIKDLLHGFLEDGSELLSNLRMTVQFMGRDAVAWLKSRDWERVLDIAKEVAGVLWQGLKDSLEILRGALGGTDWRETLVNLAEAISSFVKGIANSYSWLLGILNNLNKSGILGSGLVQGAMGVFGFLSGNAGTLITSGVRGIGTALGSLSRTLFILINEMERMQAIYLKEATTIHTFDEALAIASQSLAGFGETVALIQEIINSAGMAVANTTNVENQLLLEEGLRTQQMRIAATVEESRAMATRASTIATEAETAARESNIAAMNAESAANGSGGLLGPAKNGAGTRLGEILRTAFKGLAIGSLVGSLSSAITQGTSEAFGADKYGAANAGNIVGSIGGFASGGAIAGSAFGPLGTLIGGIGGGLVGAIKAGIESSGILDQARKDELDAFKQTVNNGEYLKEVLNSIERGNDISSDEFDMINSNLVSQMNQWAAATPSGTAQMLKDYLRAIEVNGRSIDDTVKEIGKTQDQQAETLWKFVEADDIEGGNDYAATLQNMGLSSYQISAMITQKALEHGKSRDDVINYLLLWGKTNNAAGLDLTSEMIAGMNDRDKEATVDKLKSAWTEIGMQSVENLDMDYDEKIKMSKGLGAAMSKFLTSAFDEMDVQDWWYMNRFLSTSKVSNVAEQLGYSMSPSDFYQFTWYAKKYGLTPENAGMWSSDYKGHGAEDENGNPLGSSTYHYPAGLIDEMTGGMTIQDAWNWVDQNYKDYGMSTKDVIEEWRTEQRNKDAEETAINKSQENTLWEIRDNTALIAQQGGTAQQQFEQFKSTLPQIQTLNKANGGLVFLAAGGSPRGVDIVPAMLQPGEFVVRRSAVEKVGLSAMNALNTGNLGYFARTLGRQDIYGDYNAARTWNYNRTSNDNRKSNQVVVNNFTRGARLNRYYSLANRMI